MRRLATGGIMLDRRRPICFHWDDHAIDCFAGDTIASGLLAAGVSAGVVASLLWPPVGFPLLGLATLAFTGWLGFHDVAWRTIRWTTPVPPNSSGPS